MNVKGIAIATNVIEACLDRMKNGLFQAKDIECVATAFLVKGEITMRVADRLIQKYRRNGCIKQTKVSNKMYWTWIAK